MRLTSVRVREFRSILDSQDWKIGDVTCLVGKNEAGKTSLLEALYRLNPILEGDGKFDVTEDYPRAEVEDYRQDVESKKRESAVVVQATFTLDQSEIDDIETEFGKGVLGASPTVVVSKGYDNSLSTRLPSLAEAVAVKHLVEEADLPEPLRKAAEASTTLKALADLLEQSAAKSEQSKKEALAKAGGIEDATEKAKAIDKANKLVESEAAKGLRGSLKSCLKPILSVYLWENYLKETFPKFLYFDEYYQMDGQVNIPQLTERKRTNTLRKSDHPMVGLIELSRLDLAALTAATNTQEVINKLEGTSNFLSKQILKYWSQNKHILMRFDMRQGLPGDPEEMRSGMNLWAQVHDSAHHVTVRLGTRSRGFIWFFSFLAYFSRQRNVKHPLVLLLDEPGLYLHASAQADLLRYIEAELKPHHQVVLTTHSPFMIDVNHFERIRIVRDRSMEVDDPLPPDEAGTKVLADALEADANTLFPLQGALAYDITQTMFVGPNSLVVEGVSDLIYITTIGGFLGTPLDPRWTVTPVGGGDKVQTFVALLGAQNLNIAVLLDLQKIDQQKIENLYKRKLLDKNQVSTFADFTKTAEADIEDMFEPAFYVELVNAEYAKQLSKPFTLADLTIQHPRILVRIEDHLKANPLTVGTFNHYRPARYFAENITTLGSKVDQATRERFEAAFKTLNALLKG